LTKPIECVRGRLEGVDGAALADQFREQERVIADIRANIEDYLTWFDVLTCDPRGLRFEDAVEDLSLNVILS
jgi:hypothetical protein